MKEKNLGMDVKKLVIPGTMCGDDQMITEGNF